MKRWRSLSLSSSWEIEVVEINAHLATWHILCILVNQGYALDILVKSLKQKIGVTFKHNDMTKLDNFY